MLVNTNNTKKNNYTRKVITQDTQFVPIYAQTNTGIHNLHIYKHISNNKPRAQSMKRVLLKKKVRVRDTQKKYK